VVSRGSQLCDLQLAANRFVVTHQVYASAAVLIGENQL